MNTHQNRIAPLVALVGTWLLVLFSTASAAQRPGPQEGLATQSALGTAFTYQGQLKKGNEPVSDNCQMAFGLYDEETAGNRVGSPITTTVPISRGLVTASLDFGAGVFTGDERWLEITVKCTGDGSFVALSGRQPVTAAPYAQYAPSAGSVPWSGLTGVPAGLADGVDNWITYTAGTGLALNGAEFSVVTHTIQQRVAGGWAC